MYNSIQALLFSMVCSSDLFDGVWLRVITIGSSLLDAETTESCYLLVQHSVLTWTQTANLIQLVPDRPFLCGLTSIGGHSQKNYSIFTSYCQRIIQILHLTVKGFIQLKLKQCGSCDEYF